VLSSVKAGVLKDKLKRYKCCSINEICIFYCAWGIAIVGGFFLLGLCPGEVCSPANPNQVS